MDVLVVYTEGSVPHVFEVKDISADDVVEEGPRVQLGSVSVSSVCTLYKIVKSVSSEVEKLQPILKELGDWRRHKKFYAMADKGIPKKALPATITIFDKELGKYVEQEVDTTPCPTDFDGEIKKRKDEVDAIIKKMEKDEKVKLTRPDKIA